MPKAQSARNPASLRGIRRDRDCRFCRDRGVKCDLNRPRCLPCVESGLECGGYPQRTVWASSTTSSTPSIKGRPAATAVSEPVDRSMSFVPVVAPFRMTNLDLGPPASEDKPASPRPSRQSPHTNDGRDWLLEKLSAVCRNFIFPQRPTRVKDHLPYHLSSTASPLLISRVDEFLRAHMLSGAAGLPPSPAHHLPSDNDPAPEATSGDGAVEAQQLAALSCLNQAVEIADPVAFVGMLAFAFFEVTSDGSFGHWQRHLRGARSLLDYHCHSREQFRSLCRSVTGLPEIISYFCWWDITGAVIRRLTGDASAEDQELIFLDWHRDVMSKDLFNSVGCPPDTFQLFVALAKTSGAVTSEDALQSRDKAMGQLLQLGLDSTYRGRCRDAWRCAAVIVVVTWYHVSRSYGERRPAADEPENVALQRAVERICQILPACSPSSRFYAHMAKPVFLAAMHATSPQQCGVLSKYWSNCQNGGFPRYSGALGQCQEIWRSKGLV